MIYCAENQKTLQTFARIAANDNNMNKGILTEMQSRKEKGTKSFAILIDPDKIALNHIDSTIAIAKEAQVDYFFVGGSLVVDNRVDECIQLIKQSCKIPVILFPGAPTQVSKYADGIFFLSLISGRNPELLIGQHVISAPMIKKTGLEVIPTGYMIIDGGRPTAVSYMANVQPLPADKKDIAMCTAMAGEMLGLEVIYMDAGSGALHPISTEMIARVRQNIETPLIIGGGIQTAEVAVANCKAGADIIVIGNAIEKNPPLALEISAAIHQLNA